MKIIWRVLYSTTSKAVAHEFDSWNNVIESIKLTFPDWNFNLPKEDQLTNKTRIEIASPENGWLVIRAIQLFSEPIKLYYD